MQLPLRRYLRLLAAYLAPQWQRVSLLALLLAVGTLLQLYPPQIVRRFLDTALEGSDSAALPWLALAFMLIALVGQGVAVLVRYLSELVGWSATNNLRADLIAHALKLDLGWHKAHTPGEMVERIDGDVTDLSNFFAQMIVQMTGNLLLLAGVLIALALEDWRAGLAMGLFAVITLLVLLRVRAWAAPFFARTRQAWAEFYGFLGEQLAGTEAIRASGAESYVMHRFFHLFRTVTYRSIRAALTVSVTWGSTITIFAAGDAVVLGLGAYLYLTGKISLGTVYLLFHYTQLINRPLEQIRVQLQDLQKAGGSIDRVADLMETRSNLVDGPGAPIPPGALSVRCQDLAFAYEPGEPVLRAVSFTLQPGQVLGLLGRTGSGKSTLARLLLRLYDPTEGEVHLGGTPLTAARLRELRSRVGFVTQDVQLFAATVRDNLTFFDPTIPDERLAAVLEELGLRPWLGALPRGLDTLLDGGGAGLSAGEAQLLTFARVFLADPGLIILDEASSRLDPATERLVEQAITRLLAGRTGIIIAHRLATVQRADRILILEDGAILEEGDRAALAANPDSRFATLLRTGLEEVLA